MNDMDGIDSKLKIGGTDALVTYKRATAMHSSLEVIRIAANECVLCHRRTDRYTATFRDGQPWLAIPFCDDCHDNIRKLPAREKPLELVIK